MLEVGPLFEKITNYKEIVELKSAVPCPRTCSPCSQWRSIYDRKLAWFLSRSCTRQRGGSSPPRSAPAHPTSLPAPS